MTQAVGNVLLVLLNLTGATLIAERCRAGWLVALAAQLPGAATTLRTTRQRRNRCGQPIYVSGHLAPRGVRAIVPDQVGLISSYWRRDSFRAGTIARSVEDQRWLA